MDNHPVSININDYVTHARQLMRDYHMTLPVVDDNKAVQGIISEQDILNITSTKSNVTVKGYTTEIPVITGDMDIKQAVAIMIQSKTSVVPVLESTRNRKLCGALSIADIFKNLDQSDVPDRQVKEFMTQKVKTCSSDDHLAKVWTNMVEKGYSGYPVLDNHNMLVGMVTRYDIIKSGGIRIEREDEHGSRIGTSSRISHIMSKPAYTITPEASLKEAIEMMLNLDVGRLCVTNREKLVGIIDRYDIAKACINEIQ
ncbi:MAG: CBS domain-containing protein [ANME-2 cluster archaeon]|jgi:CBS domain-containing protein|nr:CBS domain-containing protein [ANME-2 cluster archaeon]